MAAVFDLRDPVSSSSHLVTALWAVFATLMMLRLCPRDAGRRMSVMVYGISMIVLFLASGTFHGLHYSSPEQMRFFQKLDQSAIYLLIAGTNTPFLATLLPPPWRQRFLWMVWSLACAGIGSLWFLPRVPHPVVVTFYLCLGWAGIVPTYHYYRAVGSRAMRWVWLGAALYSLGAVCELTRWPVIIPGWVQSHEMLHICDTFANLAFFIFVCRYIIPYPVMRAASPDAVEPVLATVPVAAVPAPANKSIFPHAHRGVA